MNIAFRLSLQMRIPHYVRQRIINLWEKYRLSYLLALHFGKFKGNSGEFWRNSGEFWGNSGEFWRILGKSEPQLFTSFHLFSRPVRNTFPSWGNLIPLISPVATVQTGENSVGKK